MGRGFVYSAKKEFSVTCAIPALDKGEAKPIHMRQTHPLIREDVK
jgi:hypothetical protein